MKQHYIRVLLFLTLFILQLYDPQAANAQCACEGGAPANVIEHYYDMDTINTSSTVISFPLFDPAVGTLVCVRLNDTLSIVSWLGVKNLDPDDTEYEFILSLTTQVSGPSLSRSTVMNNTYGPNLLSAFGNPGDSLSYGPDTLYNNYPSVRTNTTNMVPYLGASGTVNFTYTIGGGTTAFGGANFDSRIRAKSWGRFKLSYFWCESTPLASTIKNFQAIRQAGTTRLSWLAPNENKNNIYEIQVSENGSAFRKAGTLVAQSADGITAKYEYQYHPDQPVDGKLYFRIRQSDGQTIRYSEIKVLSSEGLSHQGLQVYPNPAVRNIQMQFSSPQEGAFSLELTNPLGQVVYRRHLKLENSTQVSFTVDDPPAPGVYYVTARNRKTGQVYSSKLIVRK